MFASRRIAGLLSCLLSSCVWADGAAREYEIRRSPTMAVFYSVAADGRSVREAVDVLVIADPDASPSRTVVTGRPKARQKPQPKKVRLEVVTISVEPTRKYSFAEYRCERYGFYYTSKGECVVPAWPHRHAMQRAIYKGALHNRAGMTQPYNLPASRRR